MPSPRTLARRRIARVHVILILLHYRRPLTKQHHILHCTAAMAEQEPEKKKFEPKTKVELDPPKDDPIGLDYLAKCDGRFDAGDVKGWFGNA